MIVTTETHKPVQINSVTSVSIEEMVPLTTIAMALKKKNLPLPAVVMFGALVWGIVPSIPLVGTGPFPDVDRPARSCKTTTAAAPAVLLDSCHCAVRPAARPMPPIKFNLVGEVVATKVCAFLRKDGHQY